MKEAAAGDGHGPKHEQGKKGNAFCFHLYSPYVSGEILHRLAEWRGDVKPAGDDLTWLKAPQSRACESDKKTRREPFMTTSETIVIGLVWALLLPGLFFMLRRAWRQRQSRRKEAKKD